MTAAGETAPAPDPERAETYLRLRAEAELRQALSLPRIKQPRRRPRPRPRPRAAQPGPQSRAARFAARVQARVSQAASGRAGQGAQRVLIAVTRALRAARWTVTGRVERIRLRLPARFRQAYEPPPAYAHVNRVARLAGALAASGAVDATVAASVVTDLRAALAARSLIDQSELLGDRRWRKHLLASRMGQLRASAPAPSGPVRAFPVAVTVDCEAGGQPARVYFGALLLEPAHAMLSFRARFPAELDRHDPRNQQPPIFEVLNGFAVADESGRSYAAHFGGFGGRGSGGEWTGRLDIRPVPAAGTRWLDVTVPGSHPVRIDLTAPPARLATTSRPLPPGRSAADDYIDRLTVGMLSHDWSGSGWTEHLDSYPAMRSHLSLAPVRGLIAAVTVDDSQPEVIGAAAGLLAAGVLTDNSPSLGRLAAAAGRIQLTLPAPLAEIKPARLPAEWLALLARRDAADGPAGVVPVGASLPDLEGVSCVVTEIASAPDAATLHVHAHGWPDPPPWQPLRLRSAFRWSARDDVGGWYTASEHGGSYSSNEANLALRLFPPINPGARELQVTLTGQDGEVNVTVPLDWREGL